MVRNESSHSRVTFIDTWLAAVVRSPSVAVFKRNLAKFTFSSFYVILNNMCICVFMYFMLCILLRCKWPTGPFAFNKLIDIHVRLHQTHGTVTVSRLQTNP